MSFILPIHSAAVIEKFTKKTALYVQSNNEIQHGVQSLITTLQSPNLKRKKNLQELQTVVFKY